MHNLFPVQVVLPELQRLLTLLLQKFLNEWRQDALRDHVAAWFLSFLALSLESGEEWWRAYLDFSGQVTRIKTKEEEFGISEHRRDGCSSSSRHCSQGITTTLNMVIKLKAEQLRIEYEALRGLFLKALLWLVNTCHTYTHIGLNVLQNIGLFPFYCLTVNKLVCSPLCKA